MKRISMLLAAGILAVVGCGGDEESQASGTQRSTGSAVGQTSPDDPATTTTKNAAVNEDAADVPRPKRRGTKVALGESNFGRMLFNSRKQAIYIFEKDSMDLLGTVRRCGGKQQVTYAGKPLYYYVNEGRGEVRCHNVNLNGGLWWVVGPNGKRRA